MSSADRTLQKQSLTVGSEIFQKELKRRVVAGDRGQTDLTWIAKTKL